MKTENGKWIGYIIGRGIPYDFGGGNERVPVDLVATDFESAKRECAEKKLDGPHWQSKAP